ncbi:AMP-binding protein [Bacteriovorax sp. Seq25_V]|uniref:AMP-binding protein n=1 Tax=Bacteriovorax sp. Seq25_V TaxID=1201288 RepID=UPI00038A2A0D|nr:AMP-binding protein [Bacteriovorax sp. Seq25_V]EQC47679.1 AMP-binding enzyme [Bacteriovorax sp. Seq25_V]
MNNLAKVFYENAKRHPDKVAFVIPNEYKDFSNYSEKIITFKEFSSEVTRYQKGLLEEGYKKGDRIILLSPINENLYALMLAMFSLGLVAVFLDPGIGMRKILTAISDSNAKAIVSIDRLLKYHYFIPGLWKMKKYSCDKKRLFVKDLSSLYSTTEHTPAFVDLKESDHALITFTSGSTGRAKGSDRNIKNVTEQIKAIKTFWNCTEETIDFPSFPMFGFMNLICSITTVVPAVSFANVSDINPEIIYHQMKKWNVTRTCGSFAFNDNLSTYLDMNGLKVESLKNLALGGCPVTRSFCEKLKRVYPNVQGEIIYGSTEVAPISTITLEQYLDSTGEGFPVGKVYDGIRLSIVNLPDGIEKFDNNGPQIYSLERGMIGEVIINSAHTVQTYVDNDKATRENKILDTDGSRWHRTGDTGRIDEDGNLWLVGRLNDVIKDGENILHPYIFETKIDSMPEIVRSAMIQVNQAMVVFINTPIENFDKIKSQIKQLTPKLNNLKLEIIRTDNIPVDDRHKSKINRVLLRELYVKGKI